MAEPGRSSPGARPRGATGAAGAAAAGTRVAGHGPAGAMPADGGPGAMPPGSVLLSLRDIHVRFQGRKGWLERAPAPVLRAVDGVSLDVRAGEALGLVGESGCGKSTLARTIVGLQEPTTGEVWFAGRRISRPRPRWVPRRVQIVFQDPYSSLNPRMTLAQTIGEMLRVHHMVPERRVDARVDELLELVGLGRSVRSAHPGQLSGGQRQRVGIARALALEPQVLVADEPVSALDVSVQATILGLLEELRARLGLTLLLIAHDLAVVRQVCDRVAVMYLGRIVEQGSTETLFADPRHPYTQGLLRAVPSLHPGRRTRRTAVVGEPPSPWAVPPGCRFHPRCPLAHARCASDDPGLEARPAPGPPPADRMAGDRLAACHFAWLPPGASDGPSLAPGMGGELPGPPATHDAGASPALEVHP